MTFKEWLEEGEGWGIRQERMLEDIQPDPDNTSSLYSWLMAAYDAGRDDGYHEGLMKG
jgi:hypothetical protein